MTPRKFGYFRTLAAAALGRLALKASAVGPLIARLMVHRPVWPERDYARLAKEGYQQNPIVAGAVRMLADAVANIPWCVYKGLGDAKTEIEDHPLHELALRGPNPSQDMVEFITSVVSYYLITGNTYIERTDERSFDKMELYAWRPDRTRVVPGAYGIPEAFEYSVGGATRRIAVGGETGVDGSRPVLHIKRFNPLNDWYGQSPLDPCAWAIDLHNSSSAYNNGIIDNAGAPSGALTFEGVTGDAATSRLGDDHFKQVLAMLRNEDGGRDKPGGRSLLDGGKWGWLQFGLDPEKLQMLDAKLNAAREIALALGVPPMLLGIPGDNTYSNYQEARLALYEDAAIPLARMLVRAFNHWFAGALGKGVYIELNTDDLDALAEKRKEQWERIEKSEVLTVNEKRAAMGYEEVDGGDVLYIGAGQVPIDTPDVVTGEAAQQDDAYPDKTKKPPKGKGGAKHMPANSVHSPSDLP